LKPERGVMHFADRMNMSERVMQRSPIGWRGREEYDTTQVARFEGCTLMAAAGSLEVDSDAMQIAHALNSAAQFPKLGHCQGLRFSLAPTSQH
jgi:hypothetical protein